MNRFKLNSQIIVVLLVIFFIVFYIIRSREKIRIACVVVLIVPIPVFSNDTTEVSSKTLTEKIIPKVRQIAYEIGCDVLNLYNPFLDKSELVPDKGYIQMQKALELLHTAADNHPLMPSLMNTINQQFVSKP